MFTDDQRADPATGRGGDGHRRRRGRSRRCGPSAAAMAENEGDADQVRADAQASLAEFRELGERWGMGNCLQLLAPMQRAGGRPGRGGGELSARRSSCSACSGAIEDETMIRLRLADVLLRQGDRRRPARDRARDEQRGPGSRRTRCSATERESLFARHHDGRHRAAVGRPGRPRASCATTRSSGSRCCREPHPAQGHVTAMAHALAAKIDLADGELATADERLARPTACGIGTRDMPIVAGVGVGVAMLAAARWTRSRTPRRILGAAARLRGADDATAPDISALRSHSSTDSVPSGPMRLCPGTGDGSRRRDRAARSGAARG